MVEGLGAHPAAPAVRGDDHGRHPEPQADGQGADELIPDDRGRDGRGHVLVELGWLRRSPTTRAVQVTDEGRQGLGRSLGTQAT